MKGGRGLVLLLPMLGPAEEQLNVHQQERPHVAHSGPASGLAARPLLEVMRTLPVTAGLMPL